MVTYSIAGASFGYLTLWTSLFGLPLLAAVQLMSSRLGMVSGRGLAGDVRVHYPKWILIPMCLLLSITNIVTIGADLGGMADVTHSITGIAPYWSAAIFAIGITVLLMYFPYRTLERILKWLCLVLFAYVAAGFISRPDWASHNIGRPLRCFRATLASQPRGQLFWQ